MDIVLNVCDTLLFDRVYAWAAPLKNYQPVVDAATAGFNATKGALDPVSEYFNLLPTEFATASILARDDWRRQFISLWLITW